MRDCGLVPSVFQPSEVDRWGLINDGKMNTRQATPDSPTTKTQGRESRLVRCGRSPSESRTRSSLLEKRDIVVHRRAHFR